ncbi:uncharacterized protein Dmoj_GI26959 [Drosophila mojavensis]|uniref:Uncharacterized protein n=1 Tax=Drosophila mojavensis TaxID=7230 RepID=A0A0Q9XBG5_DROMO|nr:uncharacterized protein Dmoj_GI26959 [Drosophila mojavensis]
MDVYFLQLPFYSPPLYQLSYRRHTCFCKQTKPRQGTRFYSKAFHIVCLRLRRQRRVIQTELLPYRTRYLASAV